MTRSKKFIFMVLTCLLVLLPSIAGMEFLLRSLEKRKERLLDYADVSLGVLGLGGLLKPNFKEMLVDGYGGRIRWATNSQGFRNNYETPEVPASDVFRVASLGDSFTAGYRVGQEDSFSFQLERWLREKGDPKAEVLVSLVEEPVHALFYLQTQGMKMHPKLVVLGVTLGNDLAQVFLSLHPQGAYTLGGGGEDWAVRMNPQGAQVGFQNFLANYPLPRECLKEKTMLRKARWGLNYAWDHSRLRAALSLPAKRAIISWYGAVAQPKAFDPVHGLGFYLKHPTPEIEAAFASVRRTLQALKIFLDKNQTALTVVLFPQRFQVQQRDWQATVLEYGLREDCFDLNRPNNRIAEFCKEFSMACLDPTAGMTSRHTQTGADLYLPGGDMHWNKAGHTVFYEELKKFLLAQGLLPQSAAEKH
jgi:hypothetical protein